MIQAGKKENNPTADSLIDFLKVISEENRFRIICFLQKNNKKCVCDIWNFLDLPQNLVSHHLKVLTNFGLLNYKKDGLKVCYCVNKKELNKYLLILKNTLKQEKDGSKRN